MPINPKLKGFAALWLIIIGFVLIAGSGWWFWVNSPEEMSDLEWFVKDEERLNNEIKKDNAETAAWQTYRNEKYGFEVKYPSGTKLSEGFNQYDNTFRVIVRGDQEFQILISEQLLSATQNENERIKAEILQRSSVNTNGIIGEKVLVKRSVDQRVSKEFYKLKDELPEVIFFEWIGLFRYRNYSYLLDVSGKENEKFLDQILSTFKFIEVIALPIVDTSLWLEYKNDQYGFKIKYPYDWAWKDLLPNNQHLANDAMIGFAPKSFGGVDFEMLIQVNKRGLDANANEISTQLNENRALVSVSDILFKGKAGKKIILQNQTTKSNSTIIVISGQDNLTYIISLPKDEDFRILSSLYFY